MGCLNIHGSLLPRWRGAAPIQRAILAGDDETGVSIMQLEEGLDTGPVLLERRHPIGMHDTAGDLHDALSELGRRGAAGSHRRFCAGELVTARAAGGGRDLRRQARQIRSPLDWQLPAADLDRRVRAFNPWPMAETQFAGETLACAARQRRASPRAPARRAPGTLLGLADDGLRVACGDGVLAVRELQRAGKRPVSARDFANAVRLDGMRFGT